MRQAVALFAEKETRDELGLGSIRDAISNALFPGTSVIQTRLRYTLFIPWMYRALEATKGIHAGNVQARARDAEVALIHVLLDGGETEGVIGGRSKAALQRLPSSIYWLGLGRWGIFEQGWSIDDYHRSWGRWVETARSERSSDDRGVAVDRVRTWHPHLPAPPEDFPEQANLRLRREDAIFVQERLRLSCKGTLLGDAADASGDNRPHLEAPTPWEAFQNKVPETRWVELVLARRFALLMHGAARMYNLALARRADNQEKAAEHAAQLAEWHEEAEGERVAAWSLDELWAFAAKNRANVTPRTREFIAAWQRLYRELGSTVGGSADAARLVEQREWQLKGNRSRFRNQRGLELWSGDSGSARMNYRWATVRTLIADLYEGLDEAEA